MTCPRRRMPVVVLHNSLLWAYLLPISDCLSVGGSAQTFHETGEFQKGYPWQSRTYHYVEGFKSPRRWAPGAGEAWQWRSLPLREGSGFDLPTFPCHRTAPKWSLAWHGRVEQSGAWAWGNSRGVDLCPWAACWQLSTQASCCLLYLCTNVYPAHISVLSLCPFNKANPDQTRFMHRHLMWRVTVHSIIKTFCVW